VDTAKSIKAHLQDKGITAFLLKEHDPHWFACCECSHVCVAVLSARYFDSDVPEGQLTFAKDNGKEIVPVVIDENFHVVMSNKGNFESLKPESQSGGGERTLIRLGTDLETVVQISPTLSATAPLIEPNRVHIPNTTVLTNSDLSTTDDIANRHDPHDHYVKPLSFIKLKKYLKDSGKAQQQTLILKTPPPPKNL